VFVLPDDTTRLLSSGRVDRRLFDVTELIASRYDDAHRDTVPLIITSAKDVTPVGIAKTQDLPAVNSFAAQTHKAQATSAWQALITDRATGRSGWTACDSPLWTAASPRSARRPRGKRGSPAPA
jgi:hypothetical protein